MQYYHLEGAWKKLNQDIFPDLVSIISCWLVLKVLMPWTLPSALVLLPLPKSVSQSVFSEAVLYLFAACSFWRNARCSKENKVMSPVISAGFQSSEFHGFLGGETHYSIHTESSAWSPWLCRSNPEDSKHILLTKSAFQWSVWPGQDILSIFS